MSSVATEKRHVPSSEKAAKRLPVGPGTIVLLALTAIGLAVGITRFILGLGATTNLSDFHPWGVWIGFDVISGVALGSGAYTLAAIVYIFRLEKYRPLVRPALLTGFIGYLLVIMGLMADLGRPYRVWHVLNPPYMNLHSVLLEVGWCVVFYTTVLALEVSPLIFERLNRPKVLRVIHAITIPLVIAGIMLSTGHQSSLGSLFLAMPDKQHPLWYTPILPLLFFVSSISLGLAMVIFESSLSSKAFRHKVKKDILSGLGRVIPYVLGFYLVLRLGDLILAGEFGLMFEGSARSNLFLAEILFGGILPIVLFSLPRVRRNPKGLFWSSAVVVAGTILNRISTSLVGPLAPSGTLYFPHWMELAVTIGLVSGGVLLFTLAVHFLPVFEKAEAH